MTTQIFCLYFPIVLRCQRMDPANLLVLVSPLFLLKNSPVNWNSTIFLLVYIYRVVRPQSLCSVSIFTVYFNTLANLFFTSRFFFKHNSTVIDFTKTFQNLKPRRLVLDPRIMSSVSSSFKILPLPNPFSIVFCSLCNFTTTKYVVFLIKNILCFIVFNLFIKVM